MAVFKSAAADIHLQLCSSGLHRWQSGAAQLRDAVALRWSFSRCGVCLLSRKDRIEWTWRNGHCRCGARRNNTTRVYGWRQNYHQVNVMVWYDGQWRGVLKNHVAKINAAQVDVEDVLYTTQSISKMLKNDQTKWGENLLNIIIY